MCPSLSGDFPSRWTGAFVTTYGKYTTTFGRVEVRAAFPDVDVPGVPGVHAALWLWPQDLSYGSEVTGEMDLAEYFSQYADRAVPFLHYQPAVAGRHQHQQRVPHRRPERDAQLRHRVGARPRAGDL